MNILKNLRKKFNRFCHQHSNWGIPNLMLYVVIGSAIVYVMGMVNGGEVLYELLCFSKSKILQGQVWRLITFIFTYSLGGGLLTPIMLFFFYSMGSMIERQMGTLRFNLFYFTGVLMMDIFAMIFFPSLEELMMMYLKNQVQWYNTQIVYASMAYYLHLSLLLAFATLNPDAQFLIMFIIPIKAWVMGLIYLLLVAIEVFNASVPVMCFPHNLFPLVAVANYFLFFGKDVLYLLPKRRNQYQAPRRAPQKQQKKAAPEYQHRCVICGRTDVSHPELEFRYCSKCNGYFCYCEDHINNHTHVQ